MRAVIEPSELQDHPAARAWRELFPALPPRGLEVWSKGTPRKAGVYRLAFIDPTAPAVFAKRGPGKLLDLERTIHEQILPRLPVPSPRFVGFRQADGGDAWLFVEDVGDRSLDPGDPAQAALAGSWLGHMHTAAQGLGEASRLPDAGPERYLGHLGRARQRILSNLGNPALAAFDIAPLTSLLRQLDLVESRWDRLVAACAGFPSTLVHGDFQAKNLRLLQRDGSLELVPIDWEMAGWGIPAVDLADAPSSKTEHQVDLSAYQSAVREHWPDLSPDDLRRVTAVGHVMRRLAAIDWEASSLRFRFYRFRFNLMRAVCNLHIYQVQLATGLERLAPWVG